MARAAKVMAAWGIISKGAIARVASVAVAAMVIFGAGVVVLPVTEVQAQTINYISTVGRECIARCYRAYWKCWGNRV